MFDDRGNGPISNEESWVSFNALCTVLQLKVVNHHIYLEYAYARQYSG